MLPKFFDAKPATLYNHFCDPDFYPGLQIGGAEAAYSSRAYALTRPHDKIMLDRSLRTDFLHIRTHYSRIGLAVTDDIIWTNSSPVVPGTSNHSYESFMFGKTAHRINPDAQRLQATKSLNDKNFFMAWCREHRLPAPRTDTYQRQQIPVQRSAGPWYVKKAVSASGDKVTFAATWAEVLRAAKNVGADFQVQDEIKTDIFLNVQYFINDDGTAEHLATTQQRIEGTKHMGNYYPVTHDPRPITDKAAHAAGQLGLRGVIAFDVGVTSDDEIFLLECNPRYNGATYPTLIASRLGTSLPWQAVKLKVDSSHSITALNASDLAYNPRTKKGVVATAWGHPHALAVMVIGSLEDQLNLLAGLQELHKNRTGPALVRV